MVYREIANLAVNWYQWEVSTTEGSLTNPFVFRDVNAVGSDEEAKGGGFWSTSYFIMRNQICSSSRPSVSPSSAPPKFVSTVSSVSSTVSLTSTKPFTESTESAILSSLTLTSSLPSPSQNTLDAPTSQIRGGVSKGAVTGLAVALSLSAIIILAGIIFYIRRHKRKTLASVSPLLNASKL
ncbi:hypothetical protein BCR34DRAFT_565880 [Clohesyomyces aquaticus]|uniref:Mid2 domain-containing protein n=1 Tax=Clohesyomyces aquaticus TaxID=1231657 RepID=A0A1Y1ZLD7_9PLEO|nr:hypothetical protein BCR34DRAFT_565880 [Clohesyomyces aquaticus]